MLYILVPIYNRLSSTKQFLQSLYSQNYKKFSVVIIDDGSSDGSEIFLQEYYPDIHIIKGNGQLFWGGAINEGIKYIENIISDKDLIAFANNDIEFKEDSISKLITEYNKDCSSVFHPVTTDKSMMCLSSGAILESWPIFKTKHPFRGETYNNINKQDIIHIDFATARFLLFSASLLKKINRIDTDNFRHYAGDNDFSMRLKKINIKTYIIPASVCILDTKTTGNNPSQINSIFSFIKSLNSIKSTNNLKVRFTFGNKHCPKVYLPLYYLSVFIQVIILNLKIKRINF